MDHDLAAITGELISADANFRDAHKRFQEAKDIFTQASDERTTHKKNRKAVITMLESILKKLKSES